MKKILLGVAGTLCAVALVFSIGAPAQASTLTSAQVQAIVGLLQSFGADASIVANVQATLTGQSGVSPSAIYTTLPATSVRVCPQIDRTLNQGASGSDVSDLQEYLGVSQTGYFGPMTAQAVSSFQADEGLSQVGIVGPQTRAAFARRCGGGGGGNVNFSATPTSGGTPLSVTFSAAPGGNVGNQYSVDFGDTTSSQLTFPPCSIGGTCTGNVTHTYTSSGTYTAKLLQTTYACQTNSYPSTPACPTQTTVGTATITVGGYKQDPCDAWYPGCDGTSGAPSINGLDSPTSLSVGQTGTWTVHASAPSGTQLRYSVVWGDEGWGTVAGTAQRALTNIQTSATFSHAYQNAGTYNPTFTVSNDSGSVQTSASVVVSGNTQTATFSASPTSGFAPLATYFWYVLGADSADGYSINFGDGTIGSLSVGCAVDPFSWTNACPRGLTTNHTYTSAGTYVARLIYQPSSVCNAPPGAACPMMMPAPQTVGTVTITVTTGWL